MEGVELLLEHEERVWPRDGPHSWEALDPVSASYTPDITPIKLAAHKNNYEIIKILIDRGAALPHPHDIKVTLLPSFPFVYHSLFSVSATSALCPASKTA